MINLVMYKRKYLLDIIELFKHTVRNINSKDYTTEQINIWAPDNLDKELWHQSFCKHDTILALSENKIVGFIDLDNSYIDRLYVHKDYQHQGVASLLLQQVENIALKRQIKILQVAVSITAKSFFVNKGYKTIKQQEIIKENVVFINYLMEKYLK